MNDTRKVEVVLNPKEFSWVGDGFYTTSFIGKDIPRERMDPFFALGYNAEIQFESTLIPKGVGAHPHKGFETVTFAYKGRIEHRDSLGNHSILEEGDVQWMTAGRGLVHAEHHEKEWAKKGGIFQMVQLWLNLPAKYKETEPSYQEIQLHRGPWVKTDRLGSRVHVIAGEYQQQLGIVKTFSPVHICNVYLNPYGQANFVLPNTFNTALLVVEGDVEINGSQTLKKDQFALLENDKGECFSLSARDEKALVLVLSGQPLKETIVQEGAFIMNTQEQLKRAMWEYQSGLFGSL